MFLNTDSKYIWLNGNFQPFNDTNIHLLSHTLHYGLGAFEGVRAYKTPDGGAIFRLRDHTERLFDAANKINITIPYSIEELELAQKKAMLKNNLKEGYIRPIVFLGAESMGLRAKNLVSVNVAVACWEWPSYMSPEAKKKGISIIKSPYQQYENPLYSNNKIIGTYINSIMALHDALAKEADEAILLDKNGFISEGSGENLFLIKDSKLMTPKTDFCLNGLTRQSVIQIATDLEIDVEETDLTFDHLLEADEAFFSGTAVEITPITKANETIIGTGAIGPITEILQSKYLDIVCGNDAQYAHWLTAI
ncbi:MAG: branched-chain amino acid aminotransferase [SAR86 cluster bacterium BACL1 MAG-120920-bin57]|jgi:branched-chain amino acid aminotransferase|uniref:Branched-chain-amino-acid aminotransferase n=2 Tax=SAR86 cluster TaxID=62672 RepID=A0A0R2U9Q0_9GAMM|nr:MAG: branched-chain amino acid aminotransferase [SAR86 cluster bacterium BACL1 MAG-120507-bin14]KRO39562.1 MAG: branched-chain amino acid aminotransferase [SAR86 cluster bacterium BACL1 MAG-120920-bin57]KRO95940.1 MAG: branched-chain amino acid aminotransferase [SAR86 cluster bacterium BACL1 MAG-120820-bin45]KRO97628.1 MAG: branched-chain amino acid aminotransferase [SAR86 cluster bacterium BACL1 MAG-120828-bin5]KRO99277.1 MAG: branched-chain amino acid aminotransferase [SAR86 cluster bacter